MDFRYVILALVGLAMIIWGLPSAYSLSKAWLKIVAALVTVIGLIIFVLGILLTCVPWFFAR
ncbi:MAG: hypothetical protein FWD70_02085 [Desulfuromonadales bacterium]|nr:hypothetical protein [Desulfuromonadales bacterium]